MKKYKSKIFKRTLFLIFSFLFSMASFAAVVSDNDGAAFVSKPEFDNLKNDFQSRINDYNSSIDSKINDAISAYLNGVIIKKENRVDGYLKLINAKNANDTVFKLGEKLGFDTDDQFATVVVNPYIEINYIFGQHNAQKAYYEFDFYSHVPAPWNGQFDNPNAGARIVALDKTNLNGVNYLSLNNAYKVRKWQFQCVYAGSGENEAYTLQNSNAWPNLTIDFTNDTRPFGITEDVDIKCNQTSATVMKSVSNSVTDENNITQSASGTYYGVSNNTTNIYGWVEAENYIYDGSRFKNEQSVANTFQRRFYDSGSRGGSWNYTQNTSRMTYRIYMPEQHIFKFNELINKSATEVTNSPVYCYNGLPIIKTNKKTMKIKLPLKIENVGTNASTYKIYISDSPFDNQLARNTTNRLLYRDNNFSAITDRTIELEFNDMKERTLWLKINPSVENDVNVAFKVSLQENQQIIETVGD